MSSIVQANVTVQGSVYASTLYGQLAGSNALATSNVLVAYGLPASIVQGSNVAVFSNAAGGSNVFIMNSLGQVGIGTTSPGTTLQVYASGTTTPLNVMTASNTVYAFTTGANQGIGTGVGAIQPQMQTYQTTGGNGIYLNFYGYRHTAGTSWAGIAQRIQHTVDITQKGYIDFNPGPSTDGVAFGSGSSEYMRIVGGSVGIGTNNPSNKLDVYGGALFCSNATTSSHLALSMSNGEFCSLEAFNSTNTGKLPIALAGYGGNVGIGITNPGARLHVGDVYSLFGAYQNENTTRQQGCILQGAAWTPVNNAGTTYYAPNFTIFAGANSPTALWNFTSRPTHYAGDLVLSGGDCNDSSNNGTGPVNAYGGSLYLQGGVAYCGGGAAAAYPYVAGDVVIQTGVVANGNTDATRYERMRVKAGTGYVGIGNASPSAPLTVKGLVASGVNAYNYYYYTFPTVGVYYVILEYGGFSDTNIIDGWTVVVGSGNNPIVIHIAGTANYLRASVSSQYVVGFGSANSLPVGYNNSGYYLRVALLCS